MTAEGAAYTGPYNAATAGKAWKVGPGVAPQVDLYAYKVFGCEGTTDVTTEAIDRAVADGVDVINMSLGPATAPPTTPPRSRRPTPSARASSWWPPPATPARTRT